MIKITKGLELPIAGSPVLPIEPILSFEEGAKVHSVAIVAADYNGMKPTMFVEVGDKVAKGQLLFEDKQNPGVKYTAPVAGVVSAINRGAQRVFQSLVINAEGVEAVKFDRYFPGELVHLERSRVVSNLVDSGLWTAFRTRPYSKVPAINSIPNAVFVNVMDTNPLAFDPMLLVNREPEAFVAGLDILSRLSNTLYVCHADNVVTPKSNAGNVKVEAFSGVHPAGLTGTHIHFLNAASEKKTVWSINYQDVIAVGKLFLTGELVSDRVISLAGPAVKRPRLLQTVLGANIDTLLSDELKAGENRVISGSVLSGRIASGVSAYLGRYHLQISVVEEGRDRDFMAWLSPGINRFSILNIYLSRFMPSKKFKFTTTTNGSARAMVPVGTYEKVMPLDILPTQLLRALVVGDMEMAIKLGALELDEEDLALCTYVCPGKYEYGPILRDNLTHIEEEG